MNNIKKLRLKKGITQDELGKLLGVQKAAICKYETGRVNIPNSVIITLSEFFKVSADYLLGLDEAMPIFKTNKAENPKTSKAEPVSAAYIPLLGTVHAGMPMFADENITDYIPVSAVNVDKDEYFFMRVEGDCMIGDHITAGALVLVKKCPSVENNSIGVVRIGDEVLLRHIQIFDGHIALIPSNPNYTPLIVSEGDVEIIGRVMESRITF